MAAKLKELAEMAGDPTFLRAYNNAADLQKKNYRIRKEW
jgi:hypothetical protein